MKQGIRCGLMAYAAMLAAVVQAQRWKAELPTVDSAGLHAIVLSPEMIGRSSAGAADVRIQDAAGNAMPYVFAVAQARTEEVGWAPFNVIRNEATSRWTIVELEKPAGEPFVEEIRLTIRNTNAMKSMRITGSDDKHNWYMLADGLLMGAWSSPGRTQQIISIPASDYRFVRLALNDSLTPPLQILAAEWRHATSIAGTWTDIDDATWAISDSAGISRIRVTCPYDATIDRIEFVVEDTGRYLRTCAIERMFETTTGRDHKRRVQTRSDRSLTFQLSSDDPALVDVPALQLDTFTIVIDNGDDRPLKIADIKLKQLRRWLLADLQPGRHYTITTGDPKRQAPQYDMVHFKDRLRSPIATLQHGPLVALATAAPEGPAIDPSRWWIWAGLVAVLGLVGFMAVRMLRETPPNN